MSHKQNDAYLEEVERAEQDYKDDLEALKQAEEEMHKAYLWKNKMEINANMSAIRLSKLKSQL